ncbi:hypothetical protein [Nannocystis sp. SCPEA4]|uniref:hypothetical protein n=1 Tax=Nannocystis sp. SCPEA4 TaxID=2996787 RepID=UPI00226E4E09|nr:hypothetical protein [Nannocystis sp. SCPEA4]MCY1055975.1 hypothetical protein [Nannocystis sp. SCPEA4]
MQLPTRLVVVALVAACHARMPETEVVHGELVDYHYSLGVPGVSELDDWDEAVRASYGMSLDALVEEYLVATECPSELPSLPRLECDAPALMADPAGNFAWASSLRCDDPEVVGGMQPADEPIIIGESHLELRRTFEVVEAGEYEIAVVTPEGEGTRGQALIAECDGCAWLRGYNAEFFGSMTETRWLEPGRYSVVLRGWIEAETVEFRATRQ